MYVMYVWREREREREMGGGKYFDFWRAPSATAHSPLKVSINWYSPSLQPKNSTLIEISDDQLCGWIRTNRAMIGGSITLVTTVALSVFPSKTLKRICKCDIRYILHRIVMVTCIAFCSSKDNKKHCLSFAANTCNARNMTVFNKILET